MLDVFVKHGHNEVDNARVYCGGTSEEYLGQVSPANFSQSLWLCADAPPLL